MKINFNFLINENCMLKFYLGFFNFILHIKNNQTTAPAALGKRAGYFGVSLQSALPGHLGAGSFVRRILG